jgi:hypothetical protein
MATHDSGRSIHRDSHDANEFAGAMNGRVSADLSARRQIESGCRGARDRPHALGSSALLEQGREDRAANDQCEGRDRRHGASSQRHWATGAVGQVGQRRAAVVVIGCGTNPCTGIGSRQMRLRPI